MGLFAVSPNTALPSLILVLLPWREMIGEYREPTIKSCIEMKNEEIVSQNPFSVHYGSFAKGSCCDLLLQVRKMILPSFYDMAMVNCSQVPWCRWPCADKH